MDEIERQMCRARAKWRQKLDGKTTLWRFDNWAIDGKELHHIARWKFGDAIVPVWVSMHRELTRRAMEEHPDEGPNPNNPLERSGRLFLGVSDIVQCLSDFLGLAGEERIALASVGRRDAPESVYSRAHLTILIGIVRQCLDEIAQDAIAAV